MHGLVGSLGCIRCLSIGLVTEKWKIAARKRIADGCCFSMPVAQLPNSAFWTLTSVAARGFLDRDMLARVGVSTFLTRVCVGVR